MKGKAATVLFYLGLTLAYFRTTEAMIPYAPRMIFGLHDNPWLIGLWSYACGLLVEGVLLVAFLKIKDRNKDYATMIAALVAGTISLLFSGTMNVIDQGINDGTLVLSAGDQTTQFLHTMVTLIPLWAPLLFMIVQAIDNWVPDRGGQPSQHGQRDHKPTGAWRGGAPLSSRPPEPALIGGLGEGESDTQLLRAGSNGQKMFQTDHPSMPSLIDPSKLTVAQRHGYSD